MHLLIGIPSYPEYIPAPMVEALANLKVPPKVRTKIITGMKIDDARNELVKMALEGGCTHLLFLDSDNPPPQNTIARLLEADKDIICAPVMTRKSPHVPCVFKAHDIPDNKGVKGYTNLLQLDTSKGDVIQVDACEP